MKAKWLLITRVPNSAVIVPLFSYEEGGLHITMDRHKGLVYEVYSYALPLDAQLAERRAWNTPKALKEIT